MIRRIALGVFVIGLSVLASSATASAQGKVRHKTARGVVSAVSADSLTVKAKSGSMTFAIDPQTVVVAHGARDKGNQAQAAKQSGPKLTEVVKDGQSVLVTYQVTGGVTRATRVEVTAEPKGTK